MDQSACLIQHCRVKGRLGIEIGQNSRNHARQKFELELSQIGQFYQFRLFYQFPDILARRSQIIQKLRESFCSRSIFPRSFAAVCIVERNFAAVYKTASTRADIIVRQC